MITGPSGLPHAIIADGRRREVIAIREDWLVQDRWWTEGPVDRHYHELVVEPGRIVVVFRDTRTDTWYGHEPPAIERRRPRFARDGTRHDADVHPTPPTNLRAPGGAP